MLVVHRLRYIILKLPHVLVGVEDNPNREPSCVGATTNPAPKMIYFIAVTIMRLLKFMVNVSLDIDAMAQLYISAS
jgi:hypothetical protein